MTRTIEVFSTIILIFIPFVAKIVFFFAFSTYYEFVFAIFQNVEIISLALGSILLLAYIY